VLELGQLEFAVVAFAFVLLTDTPGHYHGIILGQVIGRLQRSPAHLYALQTALFVIVEEAADPMVLDLHEVSSAGLQVDFARASRSWAVANRRPGRVVPIIN